VENLTLQRRFDHVPSALMYVAAIKNATKTTRTIAGLGLFGLRAY